MANLKPSNKYMYTREHIKHASKKQRINTRKRKRRRKKEESARRRQFESSLTYKNTLTNLKHGSWTLRIYYVEREGSMCHLRRRTTENRQEREEKKRRGGGGKKLEKRRELEFSICRHDSTSGMSHRSRGILLKEEIGEPLPPQHTAPLLFSSFPPPSPFTPQPFFLTRCCFLLLYTTPKHHSANRAPLLLVSLPLSRGHG